MSPRESQQDSAGLVLVPRSLTEPRPRSRPAQGIPGFLNTRPPCHGRAPAPACPAGGRGSGSRGPRTRWACISEELGEEISRRRWEPTARPGRQPSPASRALENISETSHSAAEHFPVYLLPNTGIWEPAEREIRNKCGGGLDRNCADALARGPRGPPASR